MAAPPPPPSNKAKPAKKWATVEVPGHAAAQGGNLQRVKEILAQSPELVNTKDDDSWTPAHYAAWYGHLDVVRELLDRGADVNSLNGNSSSILHYAAGCGHVEIVQLLLQRGAQKDLRDKEKNTPLDLVNQLKPQNHLEIIKMLS